MRFFKNGCNGGGDRKFLLEMEGTRNRGVGFIMGGWGLFKVSLHTWQRGANPPILWRPTLLPTPLFFKFCPTHSSPPLPCHLQMPAPLYLLLTCFFGWMGDHATFDVLFYLMIWIYTYQALGPWCVFHATRWGLTHNFTGTLIWYHTQKYTQHTQGPVDWHTHLSKYLQQLLFVHSSYLYYIEWIIHWDQKFTFHNVFSVQKLFICKATSVD